MKWLNKLFRKDIKSNISEPDIVMTTNPTSHHIILEYLRSIWNGSERNPDFEQKSLSHDIDFNLVNFAELIITVCRERNFSQERIMDFLSILNVGGQNPLRTLLERLQILTKDFSEEERIKLIDSGVVGDRKEVLPIIKQFDNVAFIIKFILALEGANNQTDHSAIDEEFGYVE